MDIDYSRWRDLMAITKQCSPKEYGAYITKRKSKMRGGSKRR